jgi:hypothetical protein
MTGGLIQLSKYGPQNQYLNGNPQMTYFKTVYRRYTNFAMETIRFDFEGTRDLANSVNVQLRCKIPRNGDLLSNLYFVINIPDIYSGYNPDHDGTLSKFQWIPNLGCQMIHKCSLTIGGNIIGELYGQWIEIWHEMFQETSAKNNFDEITGHVPDLFMPSNNGYNAGYYPSSTLDPKLNKDPLASTWYTSDFKSNPFLQPPSILGRKLYIPLPFWFTTNIGLALPLIALQYHDIYIEFEMRPIIELFTICETTDNGDVPRGQRTKPSATFSWHNIGNFITSVPPNSFKPDMNLQDGIGNIQGWDMDAHVLGNFIFLDKDERKQFANNNHEYLIEQVTRQDFTGITGTQRLNLVIQHPVKYMIWCGRRSDVSTSFNNHNNYTNWQDERISPFSDAHTALFGKNSRDDLYYSVDSYGNLNTTIPLDASGSYNRTLLPTKFNFNHYSKDILKSSRLLFDGYERFTSQDNIYFRNVQSYQHNIKCDKPGIYMYSFSLDPSRYQPSGACNMSRISRVHLEVETSEVPPQSSNANTYDYDFFVFSVNYNILNVTSGMAGTAFSN